MATMKTAVGRLYMLFDACLPQNANIKKRLNICKITESNEYNELKSYAPFAGQFTHLFSMDKLNGYRPEKLEEIAAVIPKIIPLIDQLNNAIAYGNASELTEEDIPDFTSVKSVEALMGKLKVESAKQNLTNITPDNFMAVFSNKTVKDPTEVLKSVSAADINNPYDVIKDALKNTIYCIKAEDIKKIQEEYANKIAEIKAKLKGIKQEKWKLRRKKWLSIGISILILTAVNAFEVLSGESALILNIFGGLLLILYFFIG